MDAKRWLAFAVIGSALAAACDTKGMSYGDPNSIIAVTAADRWESMQEAVYGALETTIVTVRNEKEFTVTYQEPYGAYWSDLRRFRQMLLIGTASDPWMAEAIAVSDTAIRAPGVYQVRDVWARDQTVTLVVLTDPNDLAELAGFLPDVHELLDAQYRAYARERMYLSGVDSALADTLATEAGFALTLPRVYRWRHQDSAYVFRNDNPDPSELIREVTVTWRSPAPAVVDVDDVLAWRAENVAAHYSEPQDTLLSDLEVSREPYMGLDALQIQAQWRNPPDRGWPAGGPFITRVVTCDTQDRMYLIDAWLYAPGEEKYEYMIQLETIMDTFRCG